MMRLLSVLLAILFAFGLAACASGPAPPMAVPLETQLSRVKERLFVLLEAERHNLNQAAKPLILHPDLMRAAQSHSEDMAMKGSFDAMNPDGNLAVNLLLADPRFQGFVAENAAAQYYTPGTAIDPERYARGFLDIWLNSPDHRMNLAYGDFEQAGIGIAARGNTIYAAALFATDLGLPAPPVRPQ